jgi:hypothetical protein
MILTAVRLGAGNGRLLSAFRATSLFPAASFFPVSLFAVSLFPVSLFPVSLLASASPPPAFGSRMGFARFGSPATFCLSLGGLPTTH